MRFPFPDSIKYSHTLIFGSVLCVAMLMMGTDKLFTGLTLVFLLVANVAFNLSGGARYPSGMYVLANAVFTVALPVTAKTLMMEPVDRYLRVPVHTMEVYVCGMVSMTAAVLVSRTYRAKKALIADRLPPNLLGSAYVGSVAAAAFIFFYLAVIGSSGNGSLGSIFIQINRFPFLAILLGTIYTIHRTNGRKSMTWPLFLVVMGMTAMGLIGFSKEAFITPIFCWVFGAAYMRYRVSWVNLACLGLATYLAVTYMVPYAGYGRDFDLPGGGSVFRKSYYLLTHMDEVRSEYENMRVLAGPVHFYKGQVPLLDRLEVFSVDDALVEETDRYKTVGYGSIESALQNFVPHFLWPGKQSMVWGNVYAHEIEILADADVYTGVSFSPTAEAYHQGRMFAVALVEPLVLSICFLVLDSVIGNVSRNPVGLLMTILVVRASDEGMLAGGILILAQPLFGVVLAAYMCEYVLPIFAGVMNMRTDLGLGTAPLATANATSNVSV